MNGTTELIELIGLQNEICAIVQDAMPEFKTVLSSELIKEDSEYPVAHLSLSEFLREKKSDNGDGKKAYRLSFNFALVVEPDCLEIGSSIDSLESNTAYKAQKMAFALSNLLDENTFGSSDCDPAEVIAGHPNVFADSEVGFEDWYIQFEIVKRFGKELWPDFGETPEPVFSYEPKTGLGNEDEYTSLDGVAGDL